MAWAGDPAYRDTDGWIYLAGSTEDWLRVDGENLAAAPIERMLQRVTPINQVAVYGVPDREVGDQVMAAIVLNDGASLTPDEFEKFLTTQPDLSPKAWPRFVRINNALPHTATSKILKRELIRGGVAAESGVLWERQDEVPHTSWPSLDDVRGGRELFSGGVDDRPNYFGAPLGVI